MYVIFIIYLLSALCSSVFVCASCLHFARARAQKSDDSAADARFGAFSRYPLCAYDGRREAAPRRAGAARSVPLHVQREMIATGERALAEVALEGLLAGVLAVVPRQLVRAGELPRAALPCALVRLLSCKQNHRGIGIRVGSVLPTVGNCNSTG